MSQLESIPHLYHVADLEAEHVLGDVTIRVNLDYQVEVTLPDKRHPRYPPTMKFSPKLQHAIILFLSGHYIRYTHIEVPAVLFKYVELKYSETASRDDRKNPMP